MPAKKTQSERSDATRAALADAAIELLVERGWAATTSVAVCDRANVTRGALLHHHAGLSELLAAALDRLYARYAAEASNPNSLVETIDAMWSVTGDPTFKAAIEAWMAAGNDPELAASLGPVIADFAKLVHPDQRLVPALTADNPHATTFVLTAREALLGLALGRATTGGQPLPHEARVIEHLRADAARIDAIDAIDQAEINHAEPDRDADLDAISDADIESS